MGIKNGLISCFLCLMVSMVFADSDTAFHEQLKLEINGPVKSSYYLCINNRSCINMNIAKNRLVPIYLGSVHIVSILDSATRKLYLLPLPISCKTIIPGVKQIILMKGQFNSNKKGELSIAHLRCNSHK